MVKSKMNSRALLKYILGASEGDIMYSLLSEYTNTSTEESIITNYNELTLATGLEWETVRATINRLVQKGLLQKNLVIVENRVCTYFKPEFDTSIYLNFALRKLQLKEGTKNASNRNQAERLIPEIFEILQSDSNILVALGIIERSDD